MKDKPGWKSNNFIYSHMMTCKTLKINKYSYNQLQIMDFGPYFTIIRPEASFGAKNGQKWRKIESKTQKFHLFVHFQHNIPRKITRLLDKL